VSSTPIRIGSLLTVAAAVGEAAAAALGVAALVGVSARVLQRSARRQGPRSGSVLPPGCGRQSSGPRRRTIRAFAARMHVAEYVSRTRLSPIAITVNGHEPPEDTGGHGRRTALVQPSSKSGLERAARRKASANAPLGSPHRTVTRARGQL
jgi:hypothetical protein